jgi:type IV pilus biogenesis protein CpaD/CtpE
MLLRLPFRLALAAMLLPLLVGCESVRQWTPPILQPYRPDV